MLELRELTRFYGVIPAIRGVNASLRPGDVLGLLGPNGSGQVDDREDARRAARADVRRDLLRRRQRRRRRHRPSRRASATCPKKRTSTRSSRLRSISQFVGRLRGLDDETLDAAHRGVPAPVQPRVGTLPAHHRLFEGHASEGADLRRAAARSRHPRPRRAVLGARRVDDDGAARADSAAERDGQDRRLQLARHGHGGEGLHARADRPPRPRRRRQLRQRPPRPAEPAVARGGVCGAHRRGGRRRPRPASWWPPCGPDHAESRFPLCSCACSRAASSKTTCWRRTSTCVRRPSGCARRWRRHRFSGPSSRSSASPSPSSCWATTGWRWRPGSTSRCCSC